MAEDDDQPPPERVPRWLTWGSLAVLSLLLLVIGFPWQFVIVIVIWLVIWGIFAPVIYK